MRWVLVQGLHRSPLDAVQQLSHVSRAARQLGAGAAAQVLQEGRTLRHGALLRLCLTGLGLDYGVPSSHASADWRTFKCLTGVYLATCNACEFRGCYANESTELHNALKPPAHGSVRGCCSNRSANASRLAHSSTSRLRPQKRFSCPHRGRRRMRSSAVQRLFSSVLASTSGCGTGALPSTPWSPALQAAVGQPCLWHMQQTVRPFIVATAQRSGLSALPDGTAECSSRPHRWQERPDSLARPACWQQQHQQQQQQQVQHLRCLHASSALRQDFISLNNLQDNEGARRWVSTLGHAALRLVARSHVDVWRTLRQRLLIFQVSPPSHPAQTSFQDVSSV